MERCKVRAGIDVYVHTDVISVVPLVRAREWEVPQATWITEIGSGMGTRLCVDETNLTKC